MLPTFATEAEFDGWMDDRSAVHAALEVAARSVGLTGTVARFSRGSLPVGAVGDTVIKLFPPGGNAFADTEWTCLTALEGALPVPTAVPRARQTVDGWTVVAMSRLEGEELAELWDELSPETRMDLGRQVGEAVAALHRTPWPDALPLVDWPTWAQRRLAGAVARQTEKGAPQAFLDSLTEVLPTLDVSVGPGGLVWTHTEVMLEHLLVTRHARGSVRLSGLFDFEPSWVAPADYELSSLALFVARGDPSVWRAILEGLGRPIDGALPQRVLAMALLHRYSNFAWYVRRLGAPDPPTARAIAEAWFTADRVR